MITLVLGGVRSGKSEVAEHLAGPGPVTYVATAGPMGDDADFAARIERHRRRRPDGWTTVEEPCDLAGVLDRTDGTVLVDALGMWVAQAMASSAGRPDVAALVDALRRRDGDVIVVSEEVGLGVHPPTAAGRLFADLLGEANRRVAEIADRCLLVVAGRAVELPAGGTEARPARPGMPGGLDTPRGGFGSAVGFLTVFGGAAPPSAATFAWFPLVGTCLGLLLGLIWAGADELLGPLAGAAVVVAADLVLTGALHFDGLVDSADGLLPHLERGRRLAVMAEPSVGAFGVAAGATVLILRTAALASVAADDGPGPLLLAMLWGVSRTSMVAATQALPYAREHGLAGAFTGPGGRRFGPGGLRFGPGGLRFGPPALVGGLAVALAAAGVAADRPTALAALPAAALAAAGLQLLARRRLGGYTGDTLGAAGVLAETAGLLAAAATV